MVETGALQGGLLFIAHQLTAATCGDSWQPPAGGTAPGPPFRTADGHWVELEVLSPDESAAFWTSLDVSAELDRAWLSFAFRHNTARCSLPQALHDAMSRRTLREVAHEAARTGVALERLRSYPKVLAELGCWPPDPSHTRSPSETHDVDQLVVERHRRAATIWTSNGEPQEWLALVADPMLAQSAVDRIVNGAYELVLDGESYRSRQSS